MSYRQGMSFQGENLVCLTATITPVKNNWWSSGTVTLFTNSHNNLLTLACCIHLYGHLKGSS